MLVIFQFDDRKILFENDSRIQITKTIEITIIVDINIKRADNQCSKARKFLSYYKFYNIIVGVNRIATYRRNSFVKPFLILPLIVFSPHFRFIHFNRNNWFNETNSCFVADNSHLFSVETCFALCTK